jgi:tetratricopeptide (TPR) repeat protein
VYERALAIAESLARDHPTVVSYKDQLAWCLANLGVVQLARGRPVEAICLQRRVLAIRESLACDDPASTVRRSELAWCQLELGVALALETVGRSEEALRRVTQALAAHEEFVRSEPANALYRDRLAACLTHRVIQQRRAGDPAARQTAERMVAIREALARDHPTTHRYQLDLTWSYLILAAEQMAAGHPDEALINIRKAEQLVGRSHHLSPTTCYILACAYAQCAVGTRRRGGDLSPTERAASEDYAERAMAALRRAIAVGFAEASLIRQDIDLDPLRPRRDFQELLLDLTFPDDPFQR